MDNLKNHPLYRRHNIDSAMLALWEFYKTRFLALFIISFIMSGILQLMTAFTEFKDIQTITDPMQIIEKLKELIWPIVIMGLMSLLFSAILHYYVLHSPLSDRPVIGKAVLNSFRYFLPYLVVVIILLFVGVIALFLGLLALFIGIFFSATYLTMISFFILPVMMAEGTSIDGTISRTAKLAHKNFWPNMGWTAVFLILYIIISIVLSGIVLVPFAGSFMSAFANPQDNSQILSLPTNPVFIVLSSAVNAIVLPLFPIFAFILYFNGKAHEDSQYHIAEQSPVETKVKVEDLYAKPRQEGDINL